MKFILTLVPEPSTNLIKKVLKDQEIVLGRNDLNNCSFISTKHFKIFKENQEFYLEDSSTNGTHVNNELVKKKKRHLSHNDKISLPIDREKLIFKFCYTILIQKEEEEQDNIEDITQEGSYPLLEDKKRRRESKEEVLEVSKKVKKEVDHMQELLLLQKKQNEIFKIINGKNIKFEDDIILKILEYFEIRDLFKGSIFLVSKQFFNLTQKKEFWRNLCFLHFDGISFKDINWKEYFQLRSSKEMESELKIQKFIKDPDEVADINHYTEGYKRKNDFEHVTMVRYFQKDDEINSKFYIWSLKFPICVEIIISVNEMSGNLIVDEAGLVLEQLDVVKLDGMLLENARESLGHEYLKSNDDLLKYIKTICEYNGRWCENYLILGNFQNDNINYSLVI